MVAICMNSDKVMRVSIHSFNVAWPQCDDRQACNSWPWCEGARIHCPRGCHPASKYMTLLDRDRHRYSIPYQLPLLNRKNYSIEGSSLYISKICKADSSKLNKIRSL